MSARISRTIVSLASLFFGALALGIWAAPDLAARYAGVEPVRAAGTAMLRADVGGLFAGMAALCGVAAWTRRRTWIVAAATMLTAIVAGRMLGWISAGRISNDIGELAIELGAIAALAVFARSLRPDRALPIVSERGVTADRARPRSRRLALAVCAVVAVPAGVAALLAPAAEQRIFDAGARRMASVIDTTPLADDALRVAVCGSSAPLPSAARAKSCVAVFAGGKFYLVDVGPESVENLMLWRIPMSSVGGVLLTHFHSDHIGDLGELNLQTWAGGRPGPLHVYGGPGVERVVAGFSEAYRLDQGYRTTHHTEKVMPSATWPMLAHPIELDGPATPAKDRSALVLDEGGLRITAFEVDHAPIEPAYAFRFDYKGRSALITGDLKFHQPLARAAEGVDLMVSEAIAVSMTRALGEGAQAGGRTSAAAVMHDIEDYHITPEQAALIANRAHVRHLALYHLLPAPDSTLARHVFARGVDDVRQGDWTIADDGSVYVMPIGSEQVQLGKLGE
jgi:ribonuclease Z